MNIYIDFDDQFEMGTLNLVPSNEGHESGQAVPNIIIIIMIIRHKAQASHHRGIFRQCFRPGDGVIVPRAVVGVVAFKA